MSFDSLVANAGRLRILTALAVENRQDFVRLRAATELTDGNLSAHAKRLQSAGLVEIEKSFRGGKPVTTILLTDSGRQRLTTHAKALMAAVGVQALPDAVAVAPTDMHESVEDEWID